MGIPRTPAPPIHPRHRQARGRSRLHSCAIALSLLAIGSCSSDEPPSPPAASDVTTVDATVAELVTPSIASSTAPTVTAVAVEAPATSTNAEPVTTTAPPSTEPSTTTTAVVTATQPATTEPQAYVVPDGEALTDRQVEMVALLNDYVAAFQANDGEKAASFVTPEGYLEYPEMDGAVFRVSDGTFQERVSTLAAYSTLVAFAPVTVSGDRIIVSGTADPSIRWLSVIRFTPDGPVKIISESVYL